LIFDEVTDKNKLAPFLWPMVYRYIIRTVWQPCSVKIQHIAFRKEVMHHLMERWHHFTMVIWVQDSYIERCRCNYTNNV